MALSDARVVEEFTRLLEKSKQLFNGLRELPPHGHKHWQAYFGRTFDVYTKLWKFQQQYRQILDVKLGLKRWQIGEIASKIGQLYYHYYLRTSETNYLFESFAFYAAIRQRQYYSDIEAERRADLVVKKLRYYARFIVVCLLLNRTKLLDELINEFSAEIDKFARSYGPDEQLEWSLVIDELRAFLRADRCIEVVDSSGHLVPLVHRLTPFSASTPAPPMSLTANSLPSMAKSTSSSLAAKQQQQSASMAQNPFGTFNFPGVRQHLRLQEAVIVGASHAQPRFSELTIDAYRIAQAIERQPDDLLVAASASSRIYDSSPVPMRRQGGGSGGSGATAGVTLLSHGGAGSGATMSPSQTLGVSSSSIRRENPHKYLIYRPTFAQLFNCISAAHRDVSSNGVLLVYLSSDAAGGLPASPPVERTFSPSNWGINDSGHFTVDGVHRQQPPQTSPRVFDIMMNSAIQNPGGTDDADFMYGVATEAFENAPRACVTSEEHLAAVDAGVNDGYSCFDGPTKAAVAAARAAAGDGSGHHSTTPAENEQQRRRKRLKNLQQNRGRPDSACSPLMGMSSNFSSKDRNCLYPGDLYPFLRKPLMLIIDSENSSAFSNFPRLFGQPLVALLSPSRLPAPLAARRRDSGGLFTLFLHSPLAAFCFVCGVRSMPVALWDRCQAMVHKFMLATCRLFLSPPVDDMDPSYIAMFSDDFLRSLVLRYVFCHYILSCHVTTTIPKLTSAMKVSSLDSADDGGSLMPVVVSPQYLPLSCPPLPRARVLANTQLFGIVADLAATLSIVDQFPCLSSLVTAATASSAFLGASAYGGEIAAREHQHQQIYASPIYQNVMLSSQENVGGFFASKQQRSSGKHQRASSASRPTPVARPASACQFSSTSTTKQPSPPVVRANTTQRISSSGRHQRSSSSRHEKHSAKAAGYAGGGPIS